MDDALVSVWVCAVDRIAEKGKGRAGFHRGLDDHAHQIPYRNLPLLDGRFRHTREIPLLPFLAISVFQRPAHGFADFVRTHQMPHGIHVIFCQFPEQIRPSRRPEKRRVP